MVLDSLSLAPRQALVFPSGKWEGISLPGLAEVTGGTSDDGSAEPTVRRQPKCLHNTPAPRPRQGQWPCSAVEGCPGGAVCQGAEKAQSRLQSCRREVSARDTPFLMQTAQPPPAPPQKALEIQQVSTGKGQGRGCFPPHSASLARLVCAACGLKTFPKRQGRDFRSLYQVSNRSGHTVYMCDVCDECVTYA